MEQKENVYGCEGTEQTAEAEEKEKKGSAVPQKFKDVDALVRAYGSLQAEFTRRSQRLKELEKEMENFKAAATDVFSAEKRKRKADERKEEGRKFDEFLSSIEKEVVEEKPSTLQTVQTEEEQAQSGEEETVGKGRVETKLSTDAPAAQKEGEASALESVANGREIALPSSDELYEEVCKNENVRLRVIGEYLSSIAHENAPLMTGGVSMLASPQRKVKTFEEASGMALRFFQSGNGQA